MTSTIIDFIEARLRDEQAAAEAANPDDVLYRLWCAALDAIAVKDEGGSEDEYNDRREFALAMAKETLAIGDPARVLREVAAKRRIVAEHEQCFAELDAADKSTDPTDGLLLVGKAAALDLVVKLLAASWSDHPDFDPNWSTT